MPKHKKKVGKANPCDPTQYAGQQFLFVGPAPTVGQNFVGIGPVPMNAGAISTIIMTPLVDNIWIGTTTQGVNTLTAELSLLGQPGYPPCAWQLVLTDEAFNQWVGIGPNGGDPVDTFPPTQPYMLPTGETVVPNS